MQPTTPTGSRTTSELPTCSSNWKPSTSCAFTAKLPCGRPTWMSVDSILGMPTSSLTMFATSSARALRPSLMRVRNLARSCTDVCDQAGNAAFAAFTARSTSVASPAGIVAMTSSVVELMTSSVSLPEGATQAPSMYSFS